MRARARSLLLLAPLLLFLVPATSSAGPNANAYRVTKLVSDIQGMASHHDKNLVNAWGLSAGPSTPWWVADNGTNRSTLYDGMGNAIPLVVRVGGAPTGTVFNSGSGFVVSHGGSAGASLFLFDTEAGTIRGWNPGVPGPGTSTRAFTVVNRHGKGAIFKGLAIASTTAGDMLYATDFHNARVDVFDDSFHQVLKGAFRDPSLPARYAPFGIQAIGDHIFVTYAKQDAAAEDELGGAGLGFVDMYRHRRNAARPRGEPWRSGCAVGTRVGARRLRSVQRRSARRELRRRPHQRLRLGRHGLPPRRSAAEVRR